MLRPCPPPPGSTAPRPGDSSCNARDRAIPFPYHDDCPQRAFEAGDSNALELLRRVGLAVDPCIAAHDGTLVKRLGDGLMAVFPDPTEAVSAALDATESLRDVSVAG